MKWTRNRARAAAVLVALALAAGSSPAFAADEALDPEAEADRVYYALLTLDSFKAQDPGLTDVINGAAGYAVFPTVAEGQANAGEGVLFVKGIPLGTVKLSQVSKEAKGQTFSEVVLLQRHLDVTDFKNRRVKLGPEATAVEASAGSSVDVKYEKGIAVLTMSEGGLKPTAFVGGQRFTFEAYPEERVPKCLPRHVC